MIWANEKLKRIKKKKYTYGLPVEKHKFTQKQKNDRLKFW